MHSLEGSKQGGMFTLGPSTEVQGELALHGPQTLLSLHDKHEFDIRSFPRQCIHGVLHDLTKVSLLHCALAGLESLGLGEERNHFASIFPHFVTHGNSHFAPLERTVAKVHFTVDDAATLFYDFDAFGLVTDARPFIEMVADANSKVAGREIRTGPGPLIVYFTGKREIFAAETSLGRVSASHNPQPTSWGGPEGVGIQNTIFITLEFREPVGLEESISCTRKVLRFLEIMVGRPQNLTDLSFSVKSENQTAELLRVYWSLPPKRDPASEEGKPHPADVMLDVARNPERFSQVLGNWLDRENDWCHARARFSACFGKQNLYDVDRLIGTANMFDILPRSAVPADMPLSQEISDAQGIAQNVFTSLPRSPERDSVLSVLGRLGKPNLKQKVRQRARTVVGAIGERFAELPMVTDEAINCRNFYVHGGKPRFDYDEHFNSVSFFIDALEFVFAASDLIEAGWDAGAWITVPKGMSNRFARFRVNYFEHLADLKRLLLPSASARADAADS